MRKTKGHSDGIKMRGFYRVQLTEEGKGVVGDSGWKENLVTSAGIQDYIVKWLVSGSTSGGKAVGYMQLGSGGAPVASSVTLAGELTGTSGGGSGSARAAVATSIVSSVTARFTAAFASANSFVTKTENIANIGLFAGATIGSADLFAGNTFSSSTVAVNQSVNATYEIRFASA